MLSAALDMARTGVHLRSMVSGRVAYTVAEGARLPEAELSYFDKELESNALKP